MRARYMAPVLALGIVVAAGTAQEPEFGATALADGVQLFRWGSHQSLIVVTDDGVVVVDPISTDAAERYAVEIQRLAPGKPLRAIVYSHDHADHASGAHVLRGRFGGTIPIIAQANAAPRIAAANDPDLPPPDLTFTDALSLHLGGQTVELRYLGRSHSDNMVVTYLPAIRLAFAVDFVTHDRVGYRDLPDYYFPDFFDALDRLLELNFETIAFGHGPTGNRASIERQVAYYRDLRLAVSNAIERGWSEDEAAERVKLEPYAGWGQYEEWFPLNVRAIYRWLAASR